MQERKENKLRSQCHQRRHHLTQCVELGTLSSEHRAQDHVQGDPIRRREHRELQPFRPGGDLLERFLFDQILVCPHPLAVKRRHQQLAAPEMLLVLQPERRARTEHQVKIGLHVAHDVGSSLEELLDHGGVANDHRRAEERQLHRERGAIASAQRVHETSPRGDVRGALECYRPPRPWRQVRLRGHETVTSAAALARLRRRRTDSSRPRRS